MIFTLALWAVAFFLLYSNRNNKTNRWVAYCFIIASIGTFKEFLIDSFVPALLIRYPNISREFYVSIDSCLIAILYLFSPFCFITMSMYFSDFDKINKKIIPLVQLFTGLLIGIVLIFYNPIHFKFYQLNRVDFWYVMSLLNFGYPIAGCIIMFMNIKKEIVSEIKRRKRIMLEVFLVPYFYWLFTIFAIHTLDLNGLKKIWKGNVFIIIAVLLFYAYLAYKEGFMGIKISVVKYDWNSQFQSISSSTQYINHMLKNQISKINWSVDNIRKKLGGEPLEELNIIERSTRQLILFTEKTNKCLAPKIAGDDWCCASNLIFEALESIKPDDSRKINITVECKDEVLIKCDAQSIVEVIYNLINNACEAIAQNGNITVLAYIQKNGFMIEVIDDGIGIEKDQISQLFMPFYTTKKNNVNFGIGLPYCKSVMQAHEGSIEVYSSKNNLTKFILYFPSKIIKRKEVAVNGQKDKNFNC